MTLPVKIPLRFTQGDAPSYTFFYGSAPVVYKAITAATKAAPVSLTVTGHGLVTGVPIIITDVVGMTQLNARRLQTREEYEAADYLSATSVDANTLTLDLDGRSFSTYVSGGTIRYSTPWDLTGMTAMMQVRARAGSTVLIELTTENSGIELSAVDKTLTLVFTETHMANALRGVYDLKLIDGDDKPLTYFKGPFVIDKTVTLDD